MVSAPSCIPCATCHVAKCFPHLLRSGTHATEAVIANSKGKNIFHITHRDNAAVVKQSPPKLYNVRGSKLKSRLLIAAASFPRCKPLHAQTKLGFYDTELEMEFEMDDDAKPEFEPEVREHAHERTKESDVNVYTQIIDETNLSPLDLKTRPRPPKLGISDLALHDAFDGEISPLPDELTASPPRPITSAKRPQKPRILRRNPVGTDSPSSGQEKQLLLSDGAEEIRTLLGLDVFGDPIEPVQGRSLSVSPTMTAVDANSEVEVSIVDPLGAQRPPKARAVLAYVEIPRKKPSKRVASSSSDDLEVVEPPQKRSRSAHQDTSEAGRATGRGRSGSRAAPAAMRQVSSNATSSLMPVHVTHIGTVGQQRSIQRRIGSRVHRRGLRRRARICSPQGFSCCTHLFSASW